MTFYEISISLIIILWNCCFLGVFQKNSTKSFLVLRIFKKIGTQVSPNWVPPKFQKLELKVIYMFKNHPMPI
jgi:hypothetical protein